MNDIVKGVLGSLIASGLIALGAYLSYELVPEETTLSYKVSQHRTGQLSSWFIALKNNSEVPVDFVRISAPKDNLMAADYSSASPKPTSENDWEGKLSKGAEIQAMYVFSSISVFNEELLQDIVKATYQERNEISGEWETRAVEFHLGESSSRTFWKIFWFLFPFVGVSLVTFIGLYLKRKYFSSSESEGGPEKVEQEKPADT